MFISISLLALFFNCFSGVISNITVGYDDLVEVQQGLLRGHLLTTSKNTVFRAFQGIPFAQPPIGKLRFQSPQSPQSWEGILNATKDAPVCFAIDSDSPEESEDCLYLNVYTPVLNNDDEEKLPVLFWIYGGGFSHGTALYSNFGPDFLIEKGIIVVTTNYRLGPFGYLSTGDTVIPGNSGLKDQKAAIKFTFENIASFGGDPAKITIGGQSAGAASVGYQVLHKPNEGFFRGAIQESGTPLNSWSFLESSKSRSYAFDLAGQINNTVDFNNDSLILLEFLQGLDARTIDEASTRTEITRPLPVIEVDHEEAFMTESQYKLLESGEFIRVPTIIGINSEEKIIEAADLDKLNQTLEKYEQNYLKYFPSDFKLKSDVNATQIASTIRDFYFKDVPEDEKMGHMVKYLSHTSFTTAVIKHADLICNYTETYFYVFSYDGVMGNINVTIKGADSVGHAEDTKYLFKKSDSSYSNEDLSKFPEGDVLTHYRLIELWTNFVKYLNPTPDDPLNVLQNVTWPVYIFGDYQYINISDNLNIRAKPKSPYYESWVEWYQQLAEQPFTTF